MGQKATFAGFFRSPSRCGSLAIGPCTRAWTATRGAASMPMCASTVAAYAGLLRVFG
jgi:hypothetical protein